jgi:hypothetical protein
VFVRLLRVSRFGVPVASRLAPGDGDRELMGTHVNSRVANVIAWSTSLAMVTLTVALVWTSVR